MMASDRDLSEVLSEFARTLVTDFPIQSILDHLVRRIVDIMPVSGAGVTLITEGTEPRYVAASNGSALAFEKLQSRLDEGPCLVAFRTGGAVSVPDVRVDRRFPTFSPRAARMGLMAVFTFPLRQGDDRLGALDLFKDEPGSLDEPTMVVAQTLADVAAAYVVNAQARADLRDSSDGFRESALHDALTGLPNRVLLGQRLEHAAMRARRSGKKIAILFVDMDRFKEVNDTFGHQTGDQLLVAIATRLTKLLRPGDTLARMSGDEFVILCEDLDEASAAEDLAARVDSSLAETFSLKDHELKITASVGIGFSGPGMDVPERILQDADAAMYQAKGKGGAHHQVIDLRAQGVAQSTVSMLKDLRGALGRGELRTDYQPIVRTTDGRVTGVEALLRWSDPIRGLVSPETIVPIAERSGLISEIGGWVLEQACRDRRGWQDVHRPDELTISVNVSPQQLMSANFATTVATVLAETGTHPEALSLEITENVFVHDGDRALMVLHDLRDLGVTVALDDFGTGYSSLSYLKRFPVDVVKIDKGFIAEMGDPITCAIVSAVVNLAHVLGMTVVAEGVETAEQYGEVSALGCEACQGFFFARPMPAHDLGALMNRPPGIDEVRLPMPTTA
jgi:diguanylate cyclase (GGDEF)-like protein